MPYPIKYAEPSGSFLEVLFMTRDEKIQFIIEAIDAVEGAIVAPPYFESYTDEQLDKEVLWYDYLLDK
jgi:hypothetical protein